MLYPHALVRREIGDVLLEHRCGIDRYQQIEGPGRVGGPAMERGIEVVNLVGGDAGDLRGDLHIDLTLGHHTREVGLVGDRGEVEPVFARVIHQALHGEELGHVGFGLSRQAQVPEIDRAALGLIHLHGVLDRDFAAVVGGDGEQPVAVELVMQGLQVIERGVRGGDHVAAAVVPPVLLQAEARARAGNELPQTRGARPGVGVRLERALDDRQQCQLRRHVPSLELRDDVIEIHVSASERALQVIGIGRVPVELLVDRAFRPGQAGRSRREYGRRDRRIARVPGPTAALPVPLAAAVVLRPARERGRAAGR